MLDWYSMGEQQHISICRSRCTQLMLSLGNLLSGLEMATAPKATFLRTPLKILPRKSSWADTAESLDIPLITNAGPGNDRSNASTYPPPRRLHRWSTRKITALLSEALTVSIAASIFVYAVQVRRHDLIPIESNTAKILQRIAKTVRSDVSNFRNFIADPTRFPVFTQSCLQKSLAHS